MKDSLRTGITFGITSGTITVLGLMVGLNSGTHSRKIVIAGILTIAVADSFSDALGIHISEESENVHTTRQIWAATIATFISKLLFSLIFVVPVLFFELPVAIIINLSWGVSLLTIVSYFLAKYQNEKPWKVILEHLIIIAVVIISTHLVGGMIADFVKE